MIRKTAAVRDRQCAPPPASAAACPAIEDAIVAVQSEWNGWRTAMVRVTHLEDIHTAQPAGAPRPMICAFVGCDRLRPEQIDHLCSVTPPPHRLRVWVLKSHTRKDVFQELSRRASLASSDAAS